MVRINKQTGFLLLFVLVSLFSCMEENEPSRDGIDGEEFFLELPVTLSAMETQTVAPSTRTANDKSAMSVSWNEDMTTRTEQDKTAKEMEVKQLYVLQFDGIESGSKLLQCVKVTVPSVMESGSGSGTINFKFKPTQTGAQYQTVYMVANVDLSAYTTNTSLTKGEFGKKAVPFTPSTTVPATGLPMCAYNAFDPSTVSVAPAFKLKATVAKVTYSFGIDPKLTSYLKGTYTLTLNAVAKNAAYAEPGTVSTGYAPTEGCGYVSDINLGTLTVGSNATLTGTYYISEKIQGQTTGITSDTQRGKERVPQQWCTHFLLSGGKDKYNIPTDYYLYLGTPSNPNDFNVIRNHAYNITANIMGVNSADERMDGLIDLCKDSKGNPATANCYIVKGFHWYSIDVTKRGNGNESISGVDYSSLPDLSKQSEAVAKIVWNTAQNDQPLYIEQFIDGKIIFHTRTTDAEGNVVIGLYENSDANAPCLWSWHIWMVLDSPKDIVCNKTSVVTGNVETFRIMDRNLGAYDDYDNNNVGLVYQWGRKDPFPGARDFDGNESTNIFGTCNKPDGSGIGVSWRGAYSLYTYNCSSYSDIEKKSVQYPAAYMIGTDYNKYLWGTPNMSVQGVKTIFDPCPIGYRVPPHDTWSQIRSCVVDISKVYFLDFAPTGFPCAASRVWDSALYDSFLTPVNKNEGWGYYWSANAQTNSGAIIAYNAVAGTVNLNSSQPCVSALPVRCVSE